MWSLTHINGCGPQHIMINDRWNLDSSVLLLAQIPNFNLCWMMKTIDTSFASWIVKVWWLNENKFEDLVECQMKIRGAG